MDFLIARRRCDMATSCFFCQNLLSDFVEGILPSSRHEELKRHLDACGDCREVHQDLANTIQFLRKLSPPNLSNDLSIRITEAAEAGKHSFFSRRQFSRIALFAVAPVLLLFTLSFVFPNAIPIRNLWRGGDNSADYVRYFPLLQGGVEIIEEQSSMLHAREPVAGSLWEEGGLTPEEFEKSFKKGKGEGP